MDEIDWDEMEERLDSTPSQPSTLTKLLTFIGQVFVGLLTTIVVVSLTIALIASIFALAYVAILWAANVWEMFAR